jgi:hypothetical protein
MGRSWLHCRKSIWTYTPSRHRFDRRRFLTFITLKHSRRGGTHDRICEGDAAVDVFQGGSCPFLVASVAPIRVVGRAGLCEVARRYLNVLSRGQGHG